nr:hypothetical protein GCM10020092_070910 [Actinoplanes digitatis]
MPRVLVAGPASWNLIVHVADLPLPEPHALFARSHYDSLGGTSAGKALNLARLGVPVTLITLVGDDETGARITAELRAPGIDLVVIPSANGSERHVNLMDARGQRLSVYLTLPAAAHDVAVEPGLIDAADLVVADLADHSRPFLRAAREAGKPVWCDLHDYDGASEFHREFRDAADYLFLSGDRLADPEAFLRERVAAGSLTGRLHAGRAGRDRLRLRRADHPGAGHAGWRGRRHQRRRRRLLRRLPRRVPRRRAAHRVPAPGLPGGRHGCADLGSHRGDADPGTAAHPDAAGLRPIRNREARAGRRA